MLIEIEGERVDAERLWSTASSFGHFTAMQVRGRRTRGLELHLQRLEGANRELFDVSLDRDRVSELIRHALGEVVDASVRVYVFESRDGPATMVTVKDPGGVSTPQGLMSVSYQRPDAHLKHLATGQGYYSRVARQAGYDDALLTAPDGQISETAIANIGFFEEHGIVWPQAPHLRGITMQLVESATTSRRAPVLVHDVASFEGAFVSNSRGVAAVERLDDLVLPVPSRRMADLTDAYAAIPWDEI